MTEHYDVIVEGSGAGGGTLAHTQLHYYVGGATKLYGAELDNLYVVDTSLFPSIGAVNPALTAMANAIRVGEHPFSRMS